MVEVLTNREKKIVGILEPNNYSCAALQKLRENFEVKEFKGEDLYEFLFDVEVLFVRLAYLIDSDFCKMAPNLRIICSPTTGLNHISDEIINNEKVNVLSLKGETQFLENIFATAEHTFGLILALLRNYSKAFTIDGFSNFDRDALRGNELAGQKVGIIGLGRVGTQVARYCNVFGSEVSYCDLSTKSTDYCKFDSVSDLIKNNNIIICCASFIEQNGTILNSAELNLLENKYFINTARGELCDEEALISVIKTNRLKGIALDVFSNESNSEARQKWIDLKGSTNNLILTPHLGGATSESMHKTENFLVSKLLSFQGIR